VEEALLLLLLLLLLLSLGVTNQKRSWPTLFYFFTVFRSYTSDDTGEFTWSHLRNT